MVFNSMLQSVVHNAQFFDATPQATNGDCLPAQEQVEHVSLPAIVGQAEWNLDIPPCFGHDVHFEFKVTPVRWSDGDAPTPRTD